MHNKFSMANKSITKRLLVDQSRQETDKDTEEYGQFLKTRFKNFIYEIGQF